jgi:hypothetical protein
MKRIPKSFRMGSHKFDVVRMPSDELNALAGRDVYALFYPDRLTVYVQKPTRSIKASVLLQSFWHEVAHAMLWVISHKDWTNEKVVDLLGHALKQLHDTAEF